MLIYVKNNLKKNNFFLIYVNFMLIYVKKKYILIYVNFMLIYVKNIKKKKKKKTFYGQTDGQTDNPKL